VSLTTWSSRAGCGQGRPQVLEDLPDLRLRIITHDLAVRIHGHLAGYRDHPTGEGDGVTVTVRRWQPLRLDVVFLHIILQMTFSTIAE
jgi:hypothetical protein